MKRLLIAVLFILSTVIPVIAQTENASDDTVAATVNGEIIYMDTFLSKVLPSYTEISKRIEEVDPVFSDILINTEAGQNLLAEYEKRSLEALIEETLVMQYARAVGIEIDIQAIRETVNKSIMDTLTELNIAKSDADLFYILKGYIDGLASYESKVVRDLAYREALNTLYLAVTDSATVSEDEVLQYYQANSSRYAVAEEKVTVKLLLFDSFSEAYSVWKAASRDSNPAAILDTFPDVQSKSYTRQEIESVNPELVRSLFKTTKGELLPSVVTMDNRYAVIYLVSYTPAGTKSLDEMRGEIEETLINEKKDLLWKSWRAEEFEPFKQNSTITRYYDNIGGEQP